jgi:hypothetical protein
VYLSYDGAAVRLNDALFFLLLLDQQKPYSEDTNLFITGGYLLYILEEIGDPTTFGGQSSDSWVIYLRQSGQYLPLPEAWEIKPPQQEQERSHFARGLVEGASFVRWVAENYGPAAAKALFEGRRLEEVTGLFFDQAEADWLAALNNERHRPKPCEEAAPIDSILTDLCSS